MHRVVGLGFSILRFCEGFVRVFVFRFFWFCVRVLGYIGFFGFRIVHGQLSRSSVHGLLRTLLLKILFS